MQIDLSPLKRLALTEMEKCLVKLVLELLPHVGLEEETRKTLTAVLEKVNG